MDSKPKISKITDRSALIAAVLFTVGFVFWEIAVMEVPIVANLLRSLRQDNLKYFLYIQLLSFVSIGLFALFAYVTFVSGPLIRVAFCLVFGVL